MVLPLLLYVFIQWDYCWSLVSGHQTTERLSNKWDIEPHIGLSQIVFTSSVWLSGTLFSCAEHHNCRVHTRLWLLCLSRLHSNCMAPAPQCCPLTSSQKTTHVHYQSEAPCLCQHHQSFFPVTTPLNEWQYPTFMLLNTHSLNNKASLIHDVITARNIDFFSLTGTLQNQVDFLTLNQAQAGTPKLRIFPWSSVLMFLSNSCRCQIIPPFSASTSPWLDRSR